MTKKVWKEIAVDGLPPVHNKCYLVFVKGNLCQYTAYIDLGNVWRDWCSSGDGEEFAEEITHWREMPDNPVINPVKENNK